MKILGIDPGLATTGYGVIERQGSQIKTLDYGCIITSKELCSSDRLANLYDHLSQLLAQTKPDVVAIEKLFFNTNLTTGIIVSQARGVILLAIKHAQVPVAEYTPLQVKMSVCGYGAAKKAQVQLMTQSLLKLSHRPKPDDAADALAIALCYTSVSQLESTITQQSGGTGRSTA